MVGRDVALRRIRLADGGEAAPEQREAEIVKSSPRALTVDLSISASSGHFDT
jgi:hypothetical protein